MTSLKRNFDNFVHNKKDGQKSQTQFKFQKLLTNHQTNNDHFQHQTLINEIKMKNDLLNKQDKGGHLSNQQNHLTYCQRYAKILSQKYDLSPKRKSSSNLKQFKNVQKNSVKYPNSYEQIYRIIISGKNYLQNSEIEFDNFYETLSLKLKQVQIIFQLKMKKNNQNDNMIEEQLKLMELFTNKFNDKITKQHITPFTLFAQDFTSNTQKISKNSIPNDKQIIHNSMGKHQTNIQSKKVQDYNYETPNSPELLSGFNEKNRDQSDLLISFKPNLSNSQNGFETLKYSQSQLNINLSNKCGRGFKQLYNQEDAGQLPFSPVQPYRLHKLQTETANKKNTVNGEVAEPFLSNDSKQTKIAIEEIIVNVKIKTKQQKRYTQNLISIYSQSVLEIGLTIESIHVLMSDQKFMMENEWNQVLGYLQKDYKEMEILLELGKAENELKDKRFLQNLDHVQNQLIEQIFSERSCRKIEQNVLTQLLTNLIDSLQEGTQ